MFIQHGKEMFEDEIRDKLKTANHYTRFVNKNRKEETNYMR